MGRETMGGEIRETCENDVGMLKKCSQHCSTCLANLIQCIIKQMSNLITFLIINNSFKIYP